VDHSVTPTRGSNLGSGERLTSKFFIRTEIEHYTSLARNTGIKAE
jgi:hypothetical protein